MLKRIGAQLKAFPGYAQVRRVTLVARAVDDRERPAHADAQAEAREGDGEIQRGDRRDVRGSLMAEACR